MLEARASRAFDGDRHERVDRAHRRRSRACGSASTSTRPITVSHLDLDVVADGQHSVPTKMHLEADGQNVATFDLPAITDVAQPARPAVPLDFAPVTARSLRLVVDEYRAVDPDGGDGRSAPQTLPVSFAEVTHPRCRRAPPRRPRVDRRVPRPTSCASTAPRTRRADHR